MIELQREGQKNGTRGDTYLQNVENAGSGNWVEFDAVLVRVKEYTQPAIPQLFRKFVADQAFSWRAWCFKGYGAAAMSDATARTAATEVFILGIFDLIGIGLGFRR
jgi:hypothetical protein